jgi:hypothetical protein
MVTNVDEIKQIHGRSDGIETSFPSSSAALVPNAA